MEKVYKNRIDYIDVAKGLCMLLVIMQHTHTYYSELETGEFWMESFRMPLFFMISGMFFKTYYSFGEFVRKKTNSIVFPFMFFYLVFSVLVPNILNEVGYEGLRQTSKLGWSSLFNCFFEKTYSNSPVWFLLALTWLNFIFYGIFIFAKYFTHSSLVIIGMSVMFGLVGFYLGSEGDFLWANLDNALTACPYFCLGYMLMNKTTFISAPPSTTIRNKLVMWLIILIGGSVVTFLSVGVDYLPNRFDCCDLVPLYLCGFLGSVSIIALSYILFRKNKLLSWYGKNTLILLCLQMPVIQVSNIIVKKMRIEGYGGFSLTIVIVLLLFMGIIPFMNKYFPWFVGKQEIFKK